MVMLLVVGGVIPGQELGYSRLLVLRIPRSLFLIR